MAAGVRSIRRMPGLCWRNSASLATWALAEVASKTKSMSVNSAIRTRPSTPSWVVDTPRRRARARPSEAASMPTITAISRCWPWRRILIIRSVPILPEPMMATFFLCSLMSCSSRSAAQGLGGLAGDAEVGPGHLGDDHPHRFTGRLDRLHRRLGQGRDQAGLLFFVTAFDQENLHDGHGQTPQDDCDWKRMETLPRCW